MRNIVMKLPFGDELATLEPQTQVKKTKPKPRAVNIDPMPFARNVMLNMRRSHASRR